MCELLASEPQMRQLAGRGTEWHPSNGGLSRGDGFSNMFVGRLLFWPPKKLGEKWCRNDERTSFGQAGCNQQRWGGSNGWNLLIVSQSQQPKLSILEVDMGSFLKSHWEVMKTICMKDFAVLEIIPEIGGILWVSFLQKWPVNNWFPANESFAFGANDRRTVQLVVQRWWFGARVTSQSYYQLEKPTFYVLYWICNFKPAKP